MQINHQTHNLASNVSEPSVSKFSRKFLPVLFTLLQASRLHNSFVLANVGLIGFLSAGLGYNQWLLYLVGWTVLYMGIYFLNDFFDAEIDEVNKSWKPIPSKRVNRETVWKLGIFSLIAGMVLVLVSLKQATIYFPIGIVSALAAAYLGFEYSRWMKKRCPILGDMVISVVVGICFLLPFYALSDIDVNYLWSFPIYTIALLGREYQKDIEDYDADFIGQRQTLPHKYGQAFALRVSILLILSTVVYSCILTLSINGGYRYLAFTLFSIVSLYFSYKRQVSQSQAWLKPALLFTLMFDLMYWS